MTIAGEPVGVIGANAGSNGFRCLGVLGQLVPLRFRRVIGGICRLQRLDFHNFLRGALIAVAACAGAPMDRQNADEHQSSHRHSNRRHQRTPANSPTASADNRPAAADVHAIGGSRGNARAVPPLATRASGSRNRRSRMASCRMRGSGTTTPGRGVGLFASCTLFAKQLDRNGEQRRFGSIPMWTMSNGRLGRRSFRRMI